MARNIVPLLPHADELRSLPLPTVELIIKAVDTENQRGHVYALLGMICGTISFLACIAVFSYLVVHGHPSAAGVILGTGVIAIVGRMIASRL